MDSTFGAKTFYFDGGLQLEIPTADQEDFPIKLFKVEQTYGDGYFQMQTDILAERETEIDDWGFNLVDLYQLLNDDNLYINMTTVNLSTNMENPMEYMELLGHCNDDELYIYGQVQETQ